MKSVRNKACTDLSWYTSLICENLKLVSSNTSRCMQNSS